MKLNFLFRSICPNYTYMCKVREYPLIIINYVDHSATPYKLDEIMFSGTSSHSDLVNKLSWRDYTLKKL